MRQFVGKYDLKVSTSATENSVLKSKSKSVLNFKLDSFSVGKIELKSYLAKYI